MPDLQKLSIRWFIAYLTLLVGGLLFFEKSLFSDMAALMGALSGVIVIYAARRKDSAQTPKRKLIYFSASLAMALLSFANQILAAAGLEQRFWNPPYSIGEFTVLLSGLSGAYYSYIGYPVLALPALFPAYVITVYQVYDLFEKNLEWIAAPLLGPSTHLAVLALNAIGIRAWESSGYIISFTAQDGVTAGVQIVTDCTGIWSLAGFAASVMLVSLGFPKVLTGKGAVYVVFGFLGTYAANILRIVAICLSIYYDRSSGIVPATHMHAGWVAFSGWMIVFWYLFFRTYILKKENDGTQVKF